MLKYITYRAFALAAIVAAAGASCSDENRPAATDGSSRIIASMESAPQSRTCIDQTPYTSGDVGLLWMPADQIGVFGSDASMLNVCYKNESTSAQANTGFTAATAVTGTPQVAYFPYSAEAGTDRSALKGTLPLVQHWSSETMELEGDYKYGFPTTADDGGQHFTFRHMFSLLKITVDASGTGLAGQTLESVTVALAGRPAAHLGGDFTFSLTGVDASTASVNADWTAAEGANALTLKWTDTPALDAGVTHTGYMSCAPAVVQGDVLTITVTTSTHTATFTAEATCSFAANAVYNLPLALAGYADSGHNWVCAEKPAPQEEETANCYMITTAGEHDFKATVIGNGEKGIIPGAGFHTDTPYINPKSAKLLWEDTEGFISDVRLIDGRVHYTATGNTGNAVIAVYSGNNCTGDILWSWHIWGVGDTLPTDDEITNMAGASFTVMDRNLGALPEANSLTCMLYQWGRKDPFPNTTAYYVDGVETDISTTYPVYIPESADAAIIATSILHPGEMINAYKYGASNWLATDNNELWGNNDTRNYYTWRTLKNAEANAKQQSGKTIYDPSPAGYRVANQFTWTGFGMLDVADGAVTLKGDNNEGSVEQKFNVITEPYELWWKPKYTYGYYFKRNADDTEGRYYPQSGCRQGSDGSLDYRGTACYMWSSAPNSNRNNAFHLYISEYQWLDSAVGSSQAAGNNGSMKTQEFSRRWMAMAIRCVRDTE